MAFDQGAHRVRSLHRGHFDKPHDPRMRQAAQEDKLPEILVLGDEHATLFPRERQQRFVRRVGEAVPGGQDIVPEVCQCRQERPRRGAYID